MVLNPFDCHHHVPYTHNKYSCHLVFFVCVWQALYADTSHHRSIPSCDECKLFIVLYSCASMPIRHTQPFFLCSTRTLFVVCTILRLFMTFSSLGSVIHLTIFHHLCYTSIFTDYVCVLLQLFLFFYDITFSLVSHTLSPVFVTVVRVNAFHRFFMIFFRHFIHFRLNHTPRILICRTYLRSAIRSIKLLHTKYS